MVKRVGMKNISVRNEKNITQGYRNIPFNWNSNADAGFGIVNNMDFE